MNLQRYIHEKNEVIQEIKTLKITKYKLYMPQEIPRWLSEKEEKIQNIKIEGIEFEKEEKIKETMLEKLRKKCEYLKENDKYILDVFEPMELHNSTLRVQLGETETVHASSEKIKNIKNKKYKYDNKWKFNNECFQNNRNRRKSNMYKWQL